MEIGSIEFYTIAFVVAMGLLFLIFGERDHEPATSRIVQLQLEPDATPVATVTLRVVDAGLIEVVRTALDVPLTTAINVVATLVDDKLTLVEKHVADHNATSATTLSMTGRATIKLPSRRMHVRYDSAATSQWCTLTLSQTTGATASAELRY